MKTNYCKGCGIELSSDPNDKGYTPVDIENSMLCQRCHKLKHFNKLDDHGLTNEFYLEEIKNISSKKALFVYVLDILDVKSSNIKEIFELIKDKPYVILFNRVDLLPIQKNERNISMHCIKQMKDNGLNPLDFLAVSAIKNKNIDDAIEMIQQYSRGKEIVFLGTSNIGKSSLITSIVKTLESKEHEPLVSNFPGTTLACIKHQPTQHMSIWDTPGVINKNVVSTHFDKRDIRLIRNEKEIRPKMFQMNPGNTMYIGGLVKFRFISGERTGFAFVMPPRLVLHRSKTSEESRIDQRVNELKLAPEILGPKKVTKITISGHKKQMIVIGGLGFIATKPTDQEIEIETNEEVLVYKTESIL